MNRINVKRNLLLAVSGAVLGLSATAEGQYRVDNSRALDSSNRVGASGYNDAFQWQQAPNLNQINNGNQIVTGNVTAGREFRGFVPYSDPYAFRGGASGVG